MILSKNLSACKQLNTPLENLIQQQIRLRGAIPFAQFMHWALYHPELGYYCQLPTFIGKSGDFFTSASVGSLFGELLARQFVSWASHLNTPLIQCLEAGAYDGQLALDIMRAWRKLDPEQFQRVRYCILEPLARPQVWQKTRLAEFAQQVRWIQSWHEIPSQSVTGIIFSNELLDAFPVHRMGWDKPQRAWFEWGVGWNGHQFHWTRLSPPSISERPGFLGLRPSDIRSLPPALMEVLPHEFTTEICPAAEAWWHEAACRLRSGFLVAFDYGLDETSFFEPHRSNGTLEACCRHHPNRDPLSLPGQQDLTAQVNFTAIQAVGECAGLSTVRFESQSDFLIGAARIASGASPADSWRPLNLKHRLQFNSLVHPDHLGQSHKVLVQQQTHLEHRELIQT